MSNSIKTTNDLNVQHFPECDKSRAKLVLDSVLVQVVAEELWMAMEFLVSEAKPYNNSKAKF